MDGCPPLSRPSLGRPALAHLAPNACHKRQHSNIGFADGGKSGQKEKMAMALTEEQLEKRVRIDLHITTV